MTTEEKEKIEQAKKLLQFILLTNTEQDITMATIASVIEILEDLD